jgi:hypothetical protein
MSMPTSVLGRFGPDLKNEGLEHGIRQELYALRPSEPRIESAEDDERLAGDDDDGAPGVL